MMPASPPSPPPVRLAIVDVSTWDPTVEDFEVALGLLQPDSVERIRRFRSRPDALRCLIGRLIPLYALSEEQIAPARPVYIASTSHGRPYFASPLGLDWNVSHDGRLVVGAWCAQPKDRQPGTGALGVDVMWLGLPDAFPDYETLIGSLGDLLTPCEHQVQNALPDDAARTEHIIRLWTYKEAVAKLLGLGAAIEFRSLAFDLGAAVDFRSLAVNPGSRITLTSSAADLTEARARTIAFWEGRFGREGDVHTVVVADWRSAEGVAAEVAVHELSVDTVVAGARALVSGYS